MSTLKQRLGAWLLPRMPVNPWLFNTLRRELNAATVRLLHRVHPGWIAKRRALQCRSGLLVNVGCGPFGQEGWVNLDLFASAGVTMRTDCRRNLPLGDATVRGIHVEHYFEHLQPTVERPRFLAECRRCLEAGGVLRIVVPDMRLFAEAYLASGWSALERIAHDARLDEAFATKMEVLNHMFVQDGEHYGGFDEELLRRTLSGAGFRDVVHVQWREGRFPGGAIDREDHRSYSLYMEAIR